MNQNFQAYHEIFNQRANNYLFALEKFPDVRKDEYQKFVNHIMFKEGEKFLDAPSGTGVLASYISKDVIYSGADPSITFFNYCKKKIYR